MYEFMCYVNHGIHKYDLERKKSEHIKVTNTSAKDTSKSFICRQVFYLLSTTSNKRLSCQDLESKVIFLTSQFNSK